MAWFIHRVSMSLTLPCVSRPRKPYDLASGPCDGQHMNKPASQLEPTTIWFLILTYMLKHFLIDNTPAHNTNHN
jgi:hypothetical protein